MLHFIIATRNAHKVGEIRAILGKDHLYLTLADLPGAPGVVEDAPTFAGNAIKKAVSLARWCSAAHVAELSPSHPGYVLADDSGLELDALNGAPGVHSARFAALEGGALACETGNSPDAANSARLLRLLAQVPATGRTARFRCVLALTPILPPEQESASPVCHADAFELQTEVVEGTCEGVIGFEPRGRGGFGYDPLFIPRGYDLTFAELGEEVKNRLSHRARALEQLKLRLGERG